MDEMNRRRQERIKREKERLQQERRTRIRLLIAFGVLLLCGILILAFSLSSRNKQPEETTPSTQLQETQTTAPPQTTQPLEGETVIHFAAAGDLNITDNVVAAGGINFDYTPTFMDVLPILSKADLTALNLEGNVCGAPYGKDSAPQQLLNALKAAGVDMLQVANSKAINRGVAGLNATVQNVRAAGIACVGAVVEGETPGAYVIRYVKGVKVAVVAFTKGMDGMSMPAGSEEQVNLLYTDYATTYKKVNEKGITSLLRRVYDEQPDIVVALVHWGSEYSDIHSESQEQVKKLLLEEGVDVIIGSHPHFVQEIEYDETTGQLVAYSLGDFFGDADRSGTAYSLILELEITKDNTTGVTKVTGYEYTPIYTITDDTGALRVVRLESAIAGYEAGRIGRVSEESYNEMVRGLERINQRVNPKEEEE